jgi:hypothetical protein
VKLALPYKKYPDAHGGFFCSAVVPVHIALPAKNAPRSKRFEAFIDSGAALCMFHSSIGRAIGLEIDKGELSQTVGIAEEMDIYLHDICLYAPGGPISPIRAGFSDKFPVAGLLGMHGFFDHFRVVFDPTALHCELERLYHA